MGWNVHDQLVGLRVVRGPSWEWDTQDGGEGFVGTVISVDFGKNNQNPRYVKVHWDLGNEYTYRMGSEDAYDLRVLDNSTVGVKHPGVKCQECGQKDITGLRWKCLDCSTQINLCTFCFTNEKHDQSHVYFKRYDRPSSESIVIHLDTDKQKTQLKGIFPGALVRRFDWNDDWKYGEEDRGIRSIGKVVPVPTGRKITPGKIWVQWPHAKDKPYPYRVGFNGKMDLRLTKAAIGGHYLPHTFPILKISKPKTVEKVNVETVDIPLVVGDTVKFAVGLEELREMMVDCGLDWNPDEMEKAVSELGTVKQIDEQDNTVMVALPSIHDWFPEEAVERLTQWLPVGVVVQVFNGSHSIGMSDDVITGDFGRVKQVSLDEENVEMEFIKPGGRLITRKISVRQLKPQSVAISVIKQVDSIRNDLTKLLVSEVEKGATLSVEYLLKNYPNIVDCQSSYNGRKSTALSVACQKGNLEMVNLLLRHEASVHIEDEKEEEDDDEKEEEGDDDEEDEDVEEMSNKPIHHAVLGYHLEVLQLLLEKGASPNDMKWNEKTPLHLAVMKGHVECVQLLLEDERCDPHLRDSDGYTALQLSDQSSVQSLEILHVFQSAGKLNINKENFDDQNILHLAAEYNNFGTARFLLIRPEGKILAQEISGSELNTPLHVACKNGNNQISKLLVSHVDKEENGKPCGIDASNKEGQTPLMEVIESCNYEMIEFLTESGANLQAIDKNGDTPFHYAAHLFRYKERSFKQLNFIDWPNHETAPQIFQLYNELKTKHHDENLCPVTAIVYYLVTKGGIPKNLALPVIKTLIVEDFLYGEIVKISLDSS